MWHLNPASLGPCSWLATKDILGPVSPLPLSMSLSGQLCPLQTPIPSHPLGRATAWSQRPRLAIWKPS